MKYTLFYLLLILISLFSVCKKSDPVAEQQAKAAADIERLATILDSPDRQKWQMPERVVAELRLKSGHVVADIGAGTGYFARRFAEVVQPKGVSIGYDINPTMVEFMQRDANNRGIAANYRAHLIPSRNPVLEKNYYDLLFFCNTYQYLENRIQYFKSLSESLKPGGRIVVIDFTKLDKTDEESGEVPGNLVDKNIVQREFKKAGFKLKRDLKFLPSQFFLEFART
ncbi:MAG: class I SAM-dependent methyltransferase [Spirochaetes bacterium]|nr:class I SAM-dependent methyltransferase [Spirochaetota bacterium]